MKSVLNSATLAAYMVESNAKFSRIIIFSVFNQVFFSWTIHTKNVSSLTIFTPLHWGIALMYTCFILKVDYKVLAQ